MADNFVSYARDDKALITTLVEALEEEGFSVFWDGALTGGKSFPVELE